jgi:hypothetical protein
MSTTKPHTISIKNSISSSLVGEIIDCIEDVVYNIGLNTDLWFACDVTGVRKYPFYFEFCMDDFVDRNKICNYRMVCNKLNNSEEDLRLGHLTIDVIFRQKNCVIDTVITIKK